MEIPRGVLVFGNGDSYGPTGRRLMPSLSRGYKRATLTYPNGKHRTVAVHVLVRAALYGVTANPISRIVNHKSWTHI